MRPKLLLDFGQVEHLSSAALGMLINVNSKIKQQSGQLRLVNIKPQIVEVFCYYEAQQAVPDLYRPGPRRWPASIHEALARWL